MQIAIHHPLSTNLSNAYLLVSHGSRDPRPQMAIDQLADRLRMYLETVSLTKPPILVGTAQLELAAQPLHLQTSDFARQCTEIGISQVVILPLFLIPGVHVMDDIPAEVILATEKIGDLVKLKVAPFLGWNPDFANLFAQNRSGLPSQSIILAHGSRKTGGNVIVEQLAHRLDLTAAYWSVAPSLADRVAELVATGATEIGVLPYFLFAGGITDAIEKLVSELRVRYPQVQLRLGEPIGNSPELVSTIGSILESI
jgi:sirohydrochlorin cobaltochelatase